MSRHQQIKRRKDYFKLSLIMFFLPALFFWGCERQDPLSATGENFQTTSPSTRLNFLKFKNVRNSFAKRKTQKKWVMKNTGGVLHLTHGTPSGSADNFMYGVSEKSPYNIYQIDPGNVGNPLPVGQLAFKTRAIALNPLTGLIYYIAKFQVNGIYRVATWDPATNTNTILPNGASFQPAGKLAFSPDGTLFGVSGNNIFTIDSTGNCTILTTLNTTLGNEGDIAFSPDGFIYNLRGGKDKRLYKIDLSTNNVTIVGNTNMDKLSGLSFTRNGQAYLIREDGKLFAVDVTTANLTYIGKTQIGSLEDLAPVISAVELSYADVTLDVLPNSIEQDTEIEIALETTEIVGGVRVTFEPHGTTFNPPAILNIEAHGVDFTGIDPNTVDIYYENPDTGNWELMPRDAVIVNVNAGTVQVLNARLPHFSRYALAGD